MRSVIVVIISENMIKEIRITTKLQLYFIDLLTIKLECFVIKNHFQASLICVADGKSSIQATRIIAKLQPYFLNLLTTKLECLSSTNIFRQV
jgi:hypothetical protein